MKDWQYQVQWNNQENVHLMRLEMIKVKRSSNAEETEEDFHPKIEVQEKSETKCLEKIAEKCLPADAFLGSRISSLFI